MLILPTILILCGIVSSASGRKRVERGAKGKRKRRREEVGEKVEKRTERCSVKDRGTSP